MSISELLEQDLQETTIPESYHEEDPTDLEERVWSIKERFGDKLYMPGHHYQKDEVMQFADDRGDSLKLAQISASNKDAEYIVFCGVHFMAETADMLTADHQKVILPDLRAGCAMADMANIDQVRKGWEIMQETFGDTILPMTYVNSTAAIKAFVGRHGGATNTSSNAQDMMEWAFSQKERLLFLPDQHLGRNTAYDMGIPLDKMAVWDPREEKFECEGDLQEAKIILWKGYCTVHDKFNVNHVEALRKKHPDINIIVHPEVPWEVVRESDYDGSTSTIIETIENADPGSVWAIGTEMNLVNRLINENPDKEIYSLNPFMCPCLTMNRIDLQHLTWSVDKLAQGEVINQITVEENTAHYARLALDRMLERS